MIKINGKSYYTRPAASLGEYYAMRLLPLSLLERRKSFDIRMPSLDGTKKNSKRIEVKTAEFQLRSNCSGWSFYLKIGCQHRWADYYFLICLNKYLEPVASFLINKKELLGEKSVWIGKRTIRDRFWRHAFPLK